MKKFSLDIPLLEKNRILELHQKATKNLYIIKEDIGGKVLGTMNLQNLFQPGKYIVSQELSNAIDSELKRLSGTLQQYSNQKIEIKVKAGESLLGNWDQERSSKTFNTRLKPKELAKRRSDSIMNTIKSIVKKYKTENKLNLDIVFSEPEIKLGATQTTVGKRFKDYNPEMQKKFVDEQYVKVDIIATGQPSEKPNITTTTTTVNPNQRKVYSVERLFSGGESGWGGAVRGILHTEHNQERKDEYFPYKDSEEYNQMYISIINTTDAKAANKNNVTTLGTDILLSRYKLPPGKEGKLWLNHETKNYRRSYPGKSWISEEDIDWMDKNLEKVDKDLYGKPLKQTGRGSEQLG